MCEVIGDCPHLRHESRASPSNGNIRHHENCEANIAGYGHSRAKVDAGSPRTDPGLGETVHMGYEREGVHESSFLHHQRPPGWVMERTAPGNGYRS